MEQRYLLGFLTLWSINACSGIKTVNNCTCETPDGQFYSLMPFRETREPRFRNIRGKNGWLYAYNPCTPIEVGQNDPHADPKKICRDVGICKYAEIEKPREYFEAGIQTGVQCGIDQAGRIELVYKTNDSSIDNPYSKVVFLCDESASNPDFEPEDEDNYIFTIRTRCACANRCWPLPTTPTPSDIPGPTKVTAPPTPTPTPTRNQTGPLFSLKVSDSISNWKVEILLPSLAGFLAILLCLLCLWWQLAAVKEALRFRCCRCCDGYTEPVVEGGRQEQATETTALIKNQQNNQAVEHEDPGEKGKLKEPVQEEEVADDYGKHSKTVAV